MSENRRQSARRALHPSWAPPTQKSPYQVTSTLEFITPVFGGGVQLNPDAAHHKDPDPITPVRGAALRGSLRFWWRAACCKDRTLEEMQQAEARLWGWASTDSKPAKGLLSLHIESKLRRTNVTVFEQNRNGRTIAVANKRDLAYGCFPLQPSQDARDRTPGVLHQYTGSFKVTLQLDLERCPDPEEQERLWAEVRRAWLAFITFGGIGGRTRRGFGAVRCTSGFGFELDSLDKVVQHLGWQKYTTSVSQKTPEKAHGFVLGKLKAFRQGVDLGRNPGTKKGRPGRSRWPEADGIRRFSEKYPLKHKPVHPVKNVYPRAAFGLPIVFHFQGGGKTEPTDHTLQIVGENKERLASPLILRAVQTPNNKVAAVALRVPSREDLNALLRDLAFKGKQTQKGKQAEGPRGTLTAEEQPLIRPLRDERSSPSDGVDAVLEPFLNYFSS